MTQHNIPERIAQKLANGLPGLNAQLKMSPTERYTGDIYPDPLKTRKSSVLILLYEKEGSWHVPFIKRPEYDGAHSGQISLPGGKYEPVDITLRKTAIRETREEIGVTPDNIEMIGPLTPIFIPNSNFEVLPYVGYCIQYPKFEPDTYEVEQLIEAQLTDFFDPSKIQTKIQKIKGHTIQTPYYSINSHHIWGATAMIMSEFTSLFTPEEIASLK